MTLETCERRIVLEADTGRNGAAPDAWQACENPNQLVEVSLGFVVGDPIERRNQRRRRNWFLDLHETAGGALLQGNRKQFLALGWRAQKTVRDRLRPDVEQRCQLAALAH